MLRFAKSTSGLVGRVRTFSTARTSRRSSILKSLFGATVLTAGCVIFYGKVIYHSPRSLSFIGENAEFDSKIEKEFNGIPLTKMMLTASQTQFRFFFPTVDASLPARDFITEYPKSFVGYLLVAHAEKFAGNENEATKYLHLAREMVQKYPEINKDLHFLFPTDNEWNLVSPKPQLIERVPNKIWTYNKVFAVKPHHPPWDHQCTIVKLTDGSLIVINPGDYNEEDAAIIQKLGKVSSLVSPVYGHDVGIVRSAKSFPEAKLFTPNLELQQNNPNLPWGGILSDEKQLLGPELHHKHIKGSVMNEHWIYHANSKSLLGFTDLACFTNMQERGWSLRVYLFGLGVWKGSQTTILGTQNYDYLLVNDREELKKNLDEIMKWEFENVPIGHGGYFTANQEPKKRIKEAFDFLYNPSKNPELTSWEKLYLPIAYMWRIGLFGVVWQIQKNRLTGGQSSGK